MVKVKAQKTFEHFRQTCLLGRIDKALLMKRQGQLTQLSKKHERIVKKIEKRFSKDKPAKEFLFENSASPIDEVIFIFETYWHKSLLSSRQQKVHEAELAMAVRSWMATHFKTKTTKTNCFSKLQKSIEKMGFKCLTGRVSHLQELEIWRKESTRNFMVPLLESTQKVKVVFMRHFLTEGWMSYATCGNSKVGGWAKSNALFCNATEYDINSERFRVSYLTHEAQHFADYKRMKDLDSYALEYRAKLAEIVSSRRTTLKLVTRFQAQSAKDRQSYHHYAAYKVIGNLGGAISKGSVEIRKRAKSLLLADTQMRKRTGANSL